MKFLAVLFFVLLAHSSVARAAAKVEWGAFLDTYFAFDANQPANRERLYTTVPTRHSEFNVNLAYVEAKLSAERLRGRLALQTGTSVFANYSSETRDTTITRPQLADMMMFVQEAFAGYRVGDEVWIDAGIFLSHMGAESFISRDNWTYTRSLIADFSPYYQAGVKMTWQPSKTWAFQLHLLNGWQNILETNGDKALGTQIVFAPSEAFSITHNSFLGRETDVRFFQDLIVKYRLRPWWEASVSLDLGVQRVPATGSLAPWWGTSLLSRFRLSEKVNLGARLEMYQDKDGLIVTTSTPNDFEVWGASANLDFQLTPELVWRNELRWLHSRDPIYPSATGVRNSTLTATVAMALSL